MRTSIFNLPICHVFCWVMLKFYQVPRRLVCTFMSAESEGAAELPEGGAVSGRRDDAAARRCGGPRRAPGARRRAAEPEPAGRRRCAGDAQQPAPGAVQILALTPTQP